MNSDMNNNSDLLYHQFLNWLLAKSDSINSSNQQMSQNQPTSFEESTIDWEFEQLFPLDEMEEDLARQFFNPGELSKSFQQLLPMEELHNVEHRFQTLLKNKLKADIERHPPLFPWETEISEYEPDFIEDLGEPPVPVLQSSWLPQLAKLSLPALIPAKVLIQLLEGCSQAIKSVQPQPAKMVRAVSNLFPDQFHSLNYIAGIVVLSLSNREPVQELPLLRDLGDYETANPQQQMTLSMLAAKEILDSLTLTLSSRKTTVQQQWQTTAGLITLEADY
ncbi:MAG: hypothetical protein F6K10_40885, partial [Moorea sp. SIO2B7]|nr:hypothetical protein [Moorena sp. SIO2B7]